MPPLLLKGWRPMGCAEFCTYVGLLILVGVYRSLREACESLWHLELSRIVFQATMPLKTFRTYSRVLRFNDCKTRSAAGGDKLTPFSEMWRTWTERLTLMYEPGIKVTMD